MDVADQQKLRLPPIAIEGVNIRCVSGYIHTIGLVLTSAAS
jgi:hypothetical protein